MTKYKKKFFEILSDDTYGICPAPTTSDDAIQILTDYLLGEDFYIGMPMSQEQANTEIVTLILKKYSKEFRKDIVRANKEYKKKVVK